MKVFPLTATLSDEATVTLHLDGKVECKPDRDAVLAAMAKVEQTELTSIGVTLMGVIWCALFTPRFELVTIGTGGGSGGATPPPRLLR